VERDPINILLNLSGKSRRWRRAANDNALRLL
jgi:hypothetical protein